MGILSAAGRVKCELHGVVSGVLQLRRGERCEQCVEYLQQAMCATHNEHLQHMHSACVV